MKSSRFRVQLVDVTGRSSLGSVLGDTQTINGIGTTLFGHSRPQPVSPERREELERSGYIRYSYQVVKWVVVLYVPLVPLGCFRVIRSARGSWPVGTQYLMDPVAMDWGQIAWHYGVGWGGVAALVLAFRYLW